MNTFQNLLIASLMIASTSTIAADEAPAIQAPAPAVDTTWALAQIEAQVDADIAVQVSPLTAQASKEGNTWTYRQLINGQEIEIQITELAMASAKKVAKRAVEVAMNMAGF
ncbi:hypothetical protein QWY82_17285 [Simiduia curdlanivorans]|uniref:PepSY domain-containing protein n=1 Tax=Simiduia curdlanivorans TaxID=1492769 RepID=A0ABV8V7Y8_9GAMM|nr:hypothetical protein [Simiduia curdlanivorans]MDN3640554.1 hypothetical protein [Simiduia curdlanivorans]